MNLIRQITSFLWGFPMTILLLGTHLYFTLMLKGVQFNYRKLFHHFFMHKKYDKGEISQFSSFMSILAATMGTGNIIGVSTALILGGPGSVFWMVLAGILGMATKYAETWLAVTHRTEQNGTFLGGAMVILSDRHPVLAAAFCLFGAIAALGMGCSVQSNAAALMLKRTFDIPLLISALVFSFLTALVIFKGMKGISSLCSVLIPAAGTVYLCTCVSLLIIHHEYLCTAVKLIVSSAFSAQSILGGFMGSSVKNAVRYGLSRGLFTNESGMGSTPVFSASSICSSAEEPSALAMMSVFLDTVILCSITGLVFVSCTLRFPALSTVQNAEDFTLVCFSMIPVLGKPILCLSIVLFALSTIFGWCVIGERLLEFILGSWSKVLYRLLWILFVFLGCIIQLDTIWVFSDLFNALMCIPNLLMLYFYSDEIIR